MLKKSYGVDIAVRRADDLDRSLLDWVRTYSSDSLQNPCVLDIGCGSGGLSARLAEAGASVIGIDICDYSDAFESIRNKQNISETRLQFIQHDISFNLCSVGATQIDVCVIQRMIHYLSYHEAMVLLSELREINVAQLYISVTGLESDIGRNYIDKNKLVRERFGYLSEHDQDVFEITQPVCLYTPEEFLMLLQESGWTIEECWVSAFGNSKAVCR